MRIIGAGSRAAPGRRRARVSSFRTVALLALACFAGSASALTPAELAVVVNTRDPLSVHLGRYYLRQRDLPAANLIEVALPPERNWLSREEFEAVYADVTAATPQGIQAYALAWARPFRVACMSISTAFAAGFDEAWCAEPCGLTRRSPYFDATSAAPYTDYGLRPTMLLAAISEAQGEALIERGVAADGTAPRGTGYLVRTSDPRRNTRADAFPGLVTRWADTVTLRYVETDALQDRGDVLFYFTGAKQVEHLASNRFLPGAVADHLTSAGGKLIDGTRQMSALRWLEAGATGSYGAVVEPCAFPEKFPDPDVLIRHYTGGDTLVEAYWKSVAMPGQGVFIGEPLARPWRRGSE